MSARKILNLVVGGIRIELMAFSTSKRRSTTELTARER